MFALMDAQTFKNTYGVDEARRVAEKAGTTLNYFTQIACGSRNASTDLALKLVEASDDRLDLVALMTSVQRRKAREAA